MSLTESDKKKLDKISYSVLKSFGFSFDDAAHEGRVALFELRKNNYPLSSIFGLIKTKLRNDAISRLRKSAKRIEDKSVTYLDSIDTNTQSNNEQMWFEDAIRCLRGEEQELMIMFFVIGYTHAEIAARMSLSVGTVKSRLYRACNKVKLTIGEI